MKAQLILKPSERMHGNRKGDRREGSLIRLSSAARKALNYKEGDTLEVWPNSNGIDRANRSVLLNVFKAFSDDVKVTKEDTSIQPDEKKFVGFVTPETYNRIMGNNTGIKAWVSQTIHDIPIGSDPEFLLFNENDEVVNAYTVLGTTRRGRLSSDGNMVEIRPNPALTPEELVQDIKSIFNNEELTNRISNYKWKSACYHTYSHPVGGHIHIGTPLQVSRLLWNSHIFRVLNKVISEFVTIPLIKIDGNEGRARRGDGSYGHFGDFRTEHGRLEHRSLSGLWLTHPDLAKAVLGTTKAVVDEFYRLFESYNLESACVQHTYSRNQFNTEFNMWHRIPITRDIGAIRSDRAMKTIINESDRNSITDEVLNDIFSHIERFSVYNQYSEYIGALKDIIYRPVEDLEAINRDLKLNWCEEAPLFN